MTQRTTSLGTVGALALVASLVGGCLFEVPFGKDRPDGGGSPDGGAAAACRPSGCSGQLCSDTDEASTCEWREQYACYRTATCERQSDGHCGWTPTTELTSCLAGGGRPDGGVTPPVCRTPDGRPLAAGESYNDGCNECLCTESGSIACTRRACVDGGVTPPVCRTPDGRSLRVGESYFDGCNTCACQANGLLACTLRACEDAGSPTVCRTPDGRSLSVGERYYDGCNYCTCGADGSFSCTERACPDAGIPVDACHPTGCSGQLCAEHDVASTCEWREEYACYRSATCARQADGLCGWTQTPELRACLTGGRVDGGVTPPVCRTADGRTLAVGESYNDGCNDCTCTAGGGFACTRRACVDAGIPVDACRPTGCSGQICAEHAVASTCEWREEYACYRSATCERQPSGLCGWTQTPALRACLGTP